uniref:Uncharacterized protein n=1 Tax=Cairina moschata TaxID=8855 RepID=A0A8C3CD85_CAIMO
MDTAVSGPGRPPEPPRPAPPPPAPPHRVHGDEGRGAQRQQHPGPQLRQVPALHVHHRHPPRHGRPQRGRRHHGRSGARPLGAGSALPAPAARLALRLALSALHLFGDPAEVEALRGRLLAWYDRSKRDLPWRALVRAGGAAAAGSFPQLHQNGRGWRGWDGAPAGAGSFVMGSLWVSI